MLSVGGSLNYSFNLWAHTYLKRKRQLGKVAFYSKKVKLVTKINVDINGCRGLNLYNHLYISVLSGLLMYIHFIIDFTVNVKVFYKVILGVKKKWNSLSLSHNRLSISKMSSSEQSIKTSVPRGQPMILCAVGVNAPSGESWGPGSPKSRPKLAQSDSPESA